MNYQINYNNNLLEIFSENEIKYYGYIYLNFFKIYGVLFNSDKEELIKISPRSYFSIKKYKLELKGINQTIELSMTSFCKGTYEFELVGRKFKFYWHKGHRKSLYENDIQIAAYAKENYEFLGACKEIIKCNKIRHQEIVFLFPLLLRLNELRQGSSTEVTFDFGKINNGEIKYNKDWEPLV